MKLSVKAMAIGSSFLWGGGLLTCGLINLAVPSYGRRFLNMMSSVYPGFHHSRTVKDVLVGSAYGFIDGAVGGAVFAHLYNQFVKEPDNRRLERGYPSMLSAPLQ